MRIEIDLFFLSSFPFSLGRSLVSQPTKTSSSSLVDRLPTLRFRLGGLLLKERRTEPPHFYIQTLTQLAANIDKKNRPRPKKTQGMALVPSVTELLVAEMLYLQYDDATKPIYLYINSAGVVGGKQGSRLGYETEALSIYDTIEHVKPPVRTLCVGVAYGESALLLAAGQRGSRAALPSASIMLRQPMQRYTQMQASDVDIYRKEMRKTKNELFRLLSKHTGNDIERIETDLNR